MTPTHPASELVALLPSGWLIRREGSEISVCAPQATPGMTYVKQLKGRLEARLLYALADALLTTRAATVPQGVWLPIESAPKIDGAVLMGWGDYRERDGFSPAFMRWYDSVGVWSVNCLPFYPTHWQPLPTPPPAELGKGS